MPPQPAGVSLARSTKNDTAGNTQQIVANRLGDKLLTTAPRHLRENIERTAGLHDFVAVLQLIKYVITFALVVGDECGHIDVPRGDAGVLADGWGTNEGEL